jgi:hypothetical protein
MNRKYSKERGNLIGGGKVGRPTKAAPELLEKILEALARGFSREEACAMNHVSADVLENWEKKPEFPGLRARAKAARKEGLLQKIERSEEWKSAAWLLERNYKEEFGRDSVNVLNMQQNNYQLPEAKAKEIDARVQRLLGEGEQ